MPRRTVTHQLLINQTPSADNESNLDTGEGVRAARTTATTAMTEDQSALDPPASISNHSARSALATSASRDNYLNDLHQCGLEILVPIRLSSEVRAAADEVLRDKERLSRWEGVLLTVRLISCQTMALLNWTYPASLSYDWNQLMSIVAI